MSLFQKTSTQTPEASISTEPLQGTSIDNKGVSVLRGRDPNSALYRAGENGSCLSSLH